MIVLYYPFVCFTTGRFKYFQGKVVPFSIFIKGNPASLTFKLNLEVRTNHQVILRL